MVQVSFEVFAYRSKFLFLARCNLGFQSFDLRSRQLFPAATLRPFAVGLLTGWRRCQS
jgi:hypothetical protein